MSEWDGMGWEGKGEGGREGGREGGVGMDKLPLSPAFSILSLVTGLFSRANTWPSLKHSTFLNRFKDNREERG